MHVYEYVCDMSFGYRVKHMFSYHVMCDFPGLGTSMSTPKLLRTTRPLTATQEVSEFFRMVTNVCHTNTGLHKC